MRTKLTQSIQTWRWRAVVAGVLLPLTTALHGALPTAGTNYPAPGRLVSVGGHRLHLNCTGEGGPAVIMDAGLGGTSLDWIRVQPGLSRVSQVCTYDRAGYGWSERGPLPRTSGKIVDELHALLQRAQVPAPYVLVGHSFGGYNVRLFASRYPAETAAVVLVDASHERQFARFERLGVATAPRGAFVGMSGQPALPDNMPEDVRALARELISAPDAHLAFRFELASFRHSAEEVCASDPLPDVPLVVITRGKRVWPDTETGHKLEQAWMDLQDDLATRTTHASHLIAEHSGHYVQLDEPEVVVDAIAAVLHGLR
jgi:pimeloyl-ACP methyl ester carboxylesterase